jgi:hypothetical protein
MKVARRVMIPALAIALIMTGALVLLWAEGDLPMLSGITVEDGHPNGCVDCHADAGERGDYRLNVSLNELDHPDITKIVKVIPKDCGICHKQNVPAGPLNEQTHKLHYENPADNHFVTNYDGECLACHALNAETGIMTIKNGSKNW